MLGRAIKSPLLKHLRLQIFFWSIYNFSLANLVFLNYAIIITAYKISVEMNYTELVLYAFGMAFFHGTLLGITNYATNKLFFVTKSVRKALTVQSLLSLLIFVLTFAIVRFLLDQILLPDASFDGTMWSYIFNLALVHYTIGSILIAFANQVVRKFGINVVLPMLTGVYRKPRLANKIFMVIDLKSSTMLAEIFGHKKYSKFVQEFILDINRCLDSFNAEVYQYVGDEVVVIWDTTSFHTLQAIHFYYACTRQVYKRRNFYLKTFGIIPTFKSGMDCGLVTAVEVGDIKRDIAYHGDTINTASRIQSLCNELDRPLIISQNVEQLLTDEHPFTLEKIGEIKLRGKDHPTLLFAINDTDNIDTHSLEMICSRNYAQLKDAE